VRTCLAGPGIELTWPCFQSADSENNIFGRTVNPRNTSLTAGGSTGGEGALLALRGSPLGVGTDIAGSARIPALCCGIYGFKPTANRVPFSGQAYSPFSRLQLPGGVPPVAGPMGHSIDDLESLMSIISTRDPWRYDHSCIPVPWQTTKTTTSDGRSLRVLRIGIPPEDPEHTLHPPVRRAWVQANALLQRAGHTLITLPEDPTRSVALGARIAFSSYGLGQPSHEQFSAELGEPWVNSIGRGVHPFTSIPPIAADKPELGDKLSALAVAKEAYSDSWRRAWVEYDLDIVLMPGAQSTAVPHDEFGVPAYTCMWNVVDFPACIIPFGKADTRLDPDGAYATAAFDPDCKSSSAKSAKSNSLVCWKQLLM
jgi:amidase